MKPASDRCIHATHQVPTRSVTFSTTSSVVTATWVATTSPTPADSYRAHGRGLVATVPLLPALLGLQLGGHYSHTPPNLRAIIGPRVTGGCVAVAAAASREAHTTTARGLQTSWSRRQVALADLCRAWPRTPRAAAERGVCVRGASTRGAGLRSDRGVLSSIYFPAVGSPNKKLLL